VELPPKPAAGSIYGLVFFDVVDAVQLWLDMLDTTKVVYWRNIIDADILGKNSREKRNVDSTLLIPYHIRLMMLCAMA
jgi:hypothetical protein